ncbi:hypothetical protein [Shimia sp.]
MKQQGHTGPRGRGIYLTHTAQLCRNGKDHAEMDDSTGRVLLRAESLL